MSESDRIFFVELMDEIVRRIAEVVASTEEDS